VAEGLEVAALLGLAAVAVVQENFFIKK